MTRKVKLDFMVHPKFLQDSAYVPDPVLLLIVDPEAIFLTGILGESGRRMIKAGAPFYFTRRIARKLIKNGIAEEIK